MNTENEVIKFLVRTFSNIMHFLFVTLIKQFVGAYFIFAPVP